MAYKFISPHELDVFALSKAQIKEVDDILVLLRSRLIDMYDPALSEYYIPCPELQDNWIYVRPVIAAIESSYWKSVNVSRGENSEILHIYIRRK